MTKKLLNIFIFSIFFSFIFFTSTNIVLAVTCNLNGNIFYVDTTTDCTGHVGGTVIPEAPSGGVWCNVGDENILVADSDACLALRSQVAPAIDNSATPQTAAQTKTKYFSSDGSIGGYISSIYKYGIGVVGIVATVVIMIGGLIWITSMGNAASVSKAKDWIGSALTGLALAMFSFTLLWIINPDLVRLQAVNPKAPKPQVDKPCINAKDGKYCTIDTQYGHCSNGTCLLKGEIKETDYNIDNPMP